MTNKDWHDSYVRQVIEHPIVCQQLIQWVAPQDIVEAIELEKIKVVEGSYVDKKLSKTFSDIVIDCPYSKNNEQKQDAKIVVLIEHQSKPEKLLPVRVHHYMLSMLIKLMKKLPKNKPLPAIYPIIYYNGKTKEYPYSTKLRDCIYGPLSSLEHYSTQGIQVVNVNKISTEQTAKHQLAGIMACAMKRTNKEQTPQNYLSVLQQLSNIEQNSEIPPGFTESTIRYMMNVKTVDNLEALIEQNQKLPEKVRGEAMTIAEAFEQRGRVEGRVEGKVEGIVEGIAQGETTGETKGKTEVAINLLNHGMTHKQVAELTGLELSLIEELSTDLDPETH